MIPAKEQVFSNLSRTERVVQSSSTFYDLIVVGGGITGAGIAFDAASRGLKTLLVEKSDFASGTSSKSTKLIHGGLRYLKQLEFGLVRETGMERAVAHRNIPHLVHPETMLLPIVENGEFNKFTASLAISVYDYLAKVEEKDKKKVLSYEETLLAEPLLNQKILKSSVAYSEYRTDDARLTIELIKAACRMGAEAINYMKVTGFIYQDSLVHAVRCQDEYQGTEHVFKAKNIVSAAGPWVDKLRTEDRSLKGKSLHLTKGVHIVVPSVRLPLKQAVYFDGFDGRMIFAIPRGKVTYIGTSDTEYDSDLNRVLCSKKDVKYLLKLANKVFPTLELVIADVISSWAGLRPLIHEEGKSASQLSRRDEIFISSSGLISIAGGKLTGFRKMSKKVVDLVLKNSSENRVKCKTRKMKIHADSFLNYIEFLKYLKTLSESYQKNGITEFDCWYLSTTYGKNAKQLIDVALQSENLGLKRALIRAEVEFVIDFESALYPDDYFNRRSGKLYFDIQSLRDNFDFILAEFARHFGWSEEMLEIQKVKSQELIDDVTIFK